MVIALTGWLQADAVASILIGSLIVPRTIKLLRESIDVLMEATPKQIDLAAVRARLLATPHVHDVHELARQPGRDGASGAHRSRRGGRVVLRRG